VELFSEQFKKDHLLSKIDGRIKLLVALILLAMILSYKGFFFPLFVILFCLLLRAMLRVPFRIFFLRLSEPLFISAVVLFLKTFFSGHLSLFSVSLFGLKIVAYQEGLREGLMISCRIIGAVSVLTIMGFSTPFTEFMASLSWLKIPKGFIEVMVFAYRYIFVLLDESLVIYHSQKTRLGYTGLRRGISSFGTLTGSLILKVFEHSQNTAMALAQRGFDGRMPMAIGRSFKGSEILGSMIFVLAMGYLWMI
jgi:cobalt/nickel transport system permease protein